MQRCSKAVWLGLYSALLLPSLMVAAFCWQEWVSGVLYYCSDSLPWELLCPGPFAHLDTARYGQTGDYYVASEAHLQLLRWVFLGTAGIAPALLLWLLDIFATGRRTPEHAPLQTRG